MNRKLISATFFLGATMTATATAAAQETTQVAPAKDSTNYHRDSEIRGMDLWTSVDTEDGEKVDLGDIHDFVIDVKTGEIQEVVISSGGLGSVGDTLRTLNWDQVTWSEDEDGERVAMVEMSEKAFEAVAEFDPESLTKAAAAKTVEASTGKDGEMNAAPAPRVRHLCSSLADLDVFAPGASESFTTAGDLVFNCDEGKVAYVTLEANSNTYVVPFDAFVIKPDPAQELEDADEEVDYLMHAPHGPAALKGAPAVNDDNNMNAQNPEFRQAVKEFYAKAAKK